MIQYDGKPPQWNLIGAILKAHYRGAFASGEIIRVCRGETHRTSWLVAVWALIWLKCFQ